MEIKGMTMKAKVGQKGNNVFFYIPKGLSDSLGIHKGDTVVIGRSGNIGLFEKDDSLTWEGVINSLPDNYAESLRKESIPMNEIEGII